MTQPAEHDLTFSLPAEVHLSSSSFKANPYPTFAYLRACDPIHQLGSHQGQSIWLITRYKDADAVLRDVRFVKERQNVLPPEERMFHSASPASAADLMSMMMVDLDPPDHTRLRSLVSLSFTPRLIEQWRGRIQEITDELIDAVEGKESMDLIEEFAYPLPMKVISEILGIPHADSTRLHMWTKRIADTIGDPVAYQHVGQYLQAFYAYLQAFIERKRRFPTDDLVSRLIQAEADGERLSEREVVVMVYLLIVAGHDTTCNLIGNSMLALLTHPDQMALLKSHPVLIKNAVEEFLRYRSPFMQATTRWAREDIELAGRWIRRGDQVIVSLAAANHDEQEFAEPEKLDITRQENRHVAFGKGIHYCLGAPLARLEAQIALSTLLRRFPDLRLQIDPNDLTWRPGALALGVNHLPVTLQSRPFER